MVDDEWYGLENYSKYELNKSGDIRNKKTKQILARQYSRYGYRVNTIVGDDGKIHYVRNHILVAKQFIENPHNYTVVNHIDGKRDNSSIDNLEWTSHKQNSNKGDALKRIASAHEIPVNEYTNKGEYIRTWKSRKRVARYYGVHSGAVSAVVDKDGRHLKGRIFKTYEGNCNNIYVDKFLGKEQDYSKYGASCIL